jgi:branched-chain amino acid transport system substrate-binding protein
MARVCICLILVALIAGTVGCDSTPVQYTLSISSTEGGTVTDPGVGNFTYDEGTVVDLVANPNAGYRFVNWAGDVSTIANATTPSTNITMNGDYFIMANFVAVYNLNISSTAGGNVAIPGEGTFAYDAGTLVSLTASPDTGYRFVNWSGDVSTIGNSSAPLTNIAMNGNCSITANFVLSTIYVAVVGPLTDIQGQNHLGGAQMARDEINAAGGVDVNGTMCKVQLVEVETQETAEVSGLTGIANLLAAFNANPNIAFCVGGFRTECVSMYREVAMDKHVLFMNCGAATDSLQFSVVNNYSRYKYWFKSTPYNSTFLVQSCLKMISTLGGVLNSTLYAYNATLKPEYQTDASFTNPRMAIIMENAAWCDRLYLAALQYLPCLGFNVAYSVRVGPWATDISPELNAMKATYPHIIFTAFSGSVGATFSIQKASLGVPGMVIGINTLGQQLTHWVNTGGACLGEVELDTWADNLSNTPTTVAWFNAYLARFGRYPVYTAGTYDAVKLVCRAIDQTNSLNSDDLVTWLENPANAMTDSVASPKVMTYPAPAITINATTGIYALCETQVQALYPNALNSTWVRFNTTIPYFWVTAGYWMYDWRVMFSGGPHIQHDLVYGPGYTTGIGAQWQNISGAGKKVGVWPMYLGPTSNLRLTDQYGCWNFQYPGTRPLYIPIKQFQP